MKKEVSFVNKIVKQGNSLSVRVPLSIVKEGSLEEGMEVLMSIVPKEENYDYSTEIIDHLLKVSNKINKLEKYGEFEKKLFIVLNFEFLKFSKGKDLEKKGLEFDKILKKEFGAEFAKRFIDFELTLNREAFVTDNDGICILKPEYR